MRIAVSYRQEDGGFGGRLRDDLRRWLPCDEVVPARGRAPFDGLIALVGPNWRVESEDDPVRRSLEAAFQRDAGVVVVVLPGASLPAPISLPPSLAGLGDLDVVSASDEYWEPMVGRVVELTRGMSAASGGTVWQRVLRRRRLSIGAAIATVGGIVGILAPLGVFDEDQPERGLVEVERPVTNLSRESFERRRPDGGARPSAYPRAASGHAYNVELRLDHPEDDRYGLRWTARDVGQNRAIPHYEDVLWRTYAAEEVDGVHSVWVPCPPFDAVPFIVRFELTNESRPGTVRLDSDESVAVECRLVEE